MAEAGSYYCHGCHQCDWKAEGPETGTRPARAHHDETGHSAYSEKTTLFLYSKEAPEG